MNYKTSILISGNDEYVKGLMSVSLSVAMSQKGEVDIYLLSGEFPEMKGKFHKVTEDTLDFLQTNCRKHNPNISFHLIDCSELFDKHLCKGKNIKTSYTPYALLRLLIDEIPSLPDRLLYLDADTVVMKDLSEFMNIDMEGKEFAMAKDIVGHNWLGKTYANSGVILFDLESLRKSHSLATVREYMNKHHLFMPDQSAINFTQKNNRLILPYIYNEQRKTTPETVIRHYCTMPRFPKFVTIRPWQFDKFRKFYKGENAEFVDVLEPILKGL